MVTKFILVLRAQGILAIDGTAYYERMRKQPNGCHFLKTEQIYAIFMEMFAERRNTAWAITPHGSFAQIVSIEPPPQGGAPEEAARRDSAATTASTAAR